MEELKRCNKCNQLKPATSEYFSKNKNYKDGLQYRCKQCCSDDYKQYMAKHHDKLILRKRKWTKENKNYVRDYRIKNKERDKETSKAWEKTEKGHQMRLESVRKRRERLKNLLNNFTSTDWKECLKYFNNLCAYCGEKVKLENDHFIPLVKGGNYTKSNIVCACRRCNASKDDEDFFVWYPLQDFYDKNREGKILIYTDQLTDKAGGNYG
ncbi:HNH endonuclease [Ruminiclostridium hungatei]|uniref:HNH endonuclease n=1 Tax=Ruminiclostridium hungatei TaxID=48256 RepID=A0A1V4ST46_RUMHU|nr:HNH endonuclease signature motif containing protein [Ruminiclostridium hungatei]OPX46417.1 HNH endonuclease [Ruminiclostridium hungatei]